jgi:hypothetical protein
MATAARQIPALHKEKKPPNLKGNPAQLSQVVHDDAAIGAAAGGLARCRSGHRGSLEVARMFWTPLAMKFLNGRSYLGGGG